MTSGIYIIRNKVNGKVYVGSSVDIEQRIKKHKYLLERGKHGNEHLLSSWLKYGKHNFEFSIIEECDDDLYKREQYYIDKYKSLDKSFGYNKTKAEPGAYFSEEVRKKLSESRKRYWNSLTDEEKKEFGRRVSLGTNKKGENNPMYGKTHTEETKRKISDSKTGKTLSEETRKKMSYSRRKWKHTEESKRKMSESQKGRKQSPETRRKLAEYNKGKKLSEETKRKMRESQRKRRLREKGEIV